MPLLASAERSEQVLVIPALAIDDYLRLQDAALTVDVYRTVANAHMAHLSQPALSASLARLRPYFNDEILVPQGKRMLPTAWFPL